ncbi:NfeD family protein [Methylobacterium symbioticum]|uniref:Inner membrane protein YbbJ n=1 Tax=Methylobacterium symbioticum TaxID=2584084 RepID=A0A509EM71_9HYPH|nr:NfeD family protein [Methylobacterium symbioticum]VUD74794.1 Inner membrane protein YbbJ [Methylobacterium symbioticum]
MLADVAAALGPAWLWITGGLMLAGAEILLPGIFLIWLGLAALLTGLGTALVPMPWQAQLLVWAVLSLGSVALATRLNRRRAEPVLNRADRGLVGREAVLAEAIVGGAGALRLDDTYWRVSGPDLPAGARVRIVGLAGTVLTVVAA